jgi:hypothetical protein
MDLVPVNPAPEFPYDAPRNFSNHYWAMLVELFYELGGRMEGFSTSNDGEVIPEYVCQRVADKLEANLERFVEEDQLFIRSIIPFWRYCGGCRQW